MRVTVLGSGTLLPDDRHRSPAHWVEEGESRLLLDCGSGALHGMARERLRWKDVTHVALSHFHTDHVADLAPLLFALRYGIRPARTEPLALLGPRGLADHLDALTRAHGAYVTAPGFPLQVVELAHGAIWTDPAGGFTLHAYATPHTDSSLAFRVEAEAGTVGYTGDTGPSEALGAFFRGVQLLISECALADPPEIDTHLSPRSAAALAVAADPGLLVLTHLYPPLRPVRLPDLIRAAGYAGPLAVAADGLAVEIDGGAPRVVVG
jgi:ribonuclease BN (tRNA processing enzyme)